MSIIEPKQAERRIVMRGVAWPTYEALLRDLADCSSPRLTFCEPRQQSLNLPDFPVEQLSQWRERHHQVDETNWAREFRNSLHA